MNSPAEPEYLGSYRLLEKLGQGGMAVVYRAERAGEAGFRKKVAVKRILPQYRRDASLLERFAAEARTNARLDHPNLVHVLDFGIEPEPFLVLEFVEGITLGQVLLRLSERNEPMDLAAAGFIGAEVAAGLDHAHRKRGDDGTPLGIVHRDVSPQNVLISNEGGVKVSDFGLVKAADNVLQTSSGVRIGKLSYMAPEQAEGEEIDARADVFSLGVTLWEMLTTRSLIPPNDMTTAMALRRAGDFPPPSRFNAAVPPRLDAIVMGCLMLSATERTPSAQQVAQDLREFLHEHAPGYGQQQLARMVQWLFPERGWAIPEPERTAAQPSPVERASMLPFTPAAVAAARIAAPRETNPAPTAAGAPPNGWLALSIGAVAGAVSVVVVLTALIVLGVMYWRMVGGPNEVEFYANAGGTTLYLGPRELGIAPLVLRSDQLTGEPLVAIARGYQPRVLRAERLVELVRSGEARHRVELEAAAEPARAIYIRCDGQGQAYLNGNTLGPVPGVVLLPSDEQGAITVVDEDHERVRPIDVSGCLSDRVCVIEAE